MEVAEGPGSAKYGLTKTAPTRPESWMYYFFSG